MYLLHADIPCIFIRSYLIIHMYEHIWHRIGVLKRIPGLYLLYRTLQNKLDNRSFIIPAGPLKGYRWHYSKTHQLWMGLGMYEPHTARWLLQHLRPGDVFYDIGANAGYFTLLAARQVAPEGHVFAFEPVPLNISIIQKQIHMNRLDTVCTVIPVAVCDRKGVASLLVPPQNAYAHLEMLEVSSPGVLDKVTTYEVETTSLDTWCTEHPPPSCIKIDVEGAEYTVLQGSIRVLSTYAPRLCVATHSPSLRHSVCELLHELGYTWNTAPEDLAVIYAIPSQR